MAKTGAFMRMAARKAGDSQPSKTCAAGPVIQTPSSRQSTSSVPPSSVDAHLPPGQPAQVGGDGGGAGARAAGERDARAALPHPHAQAVGGGQAGEFDIGAAGGNSGSCSKRGPRPGRSTASASGTKNTQCGLPMPTATGSPGRGRCSVSAARGQRHLGPVQLRRAHVDRDQPIGPAHCAARCRARWSASPRRGPSRAITRSQTQRVALPQASARLPSLFQKSSAKSALSAVADLGQLVEAHAAVAVAQRARQRRRHHRPAPARVDHDEIIARSMHLHEAKAGVCLRGSWPALYAGTGEFASGPALLPLTLWADHPNQRPRGPVAQLVEQLTFNQ